VNVPVSEEEPTTYTVNVPKQEDKM
jgi:hypothetical protein